MDNNILMFTILILFQLAVVSIVLAIFSSVFVKSRKKGLVFLTIYILLSIYSLYDVYKYSAILGSMLIIYISLGVVTYFVIKETLKWNRNLDSSTPMKDFNHLSFSVVWRWFLRYMGG
ncbi:hypothetical protein [Lysinibacillus sp. NPDC092081]|uniref:hypothetical protein n=1 Tax=Lysinibacillus sp. NPDC092081 TaxID=3364131 RepID=UPI0038248E0E